MVVRFAVEPAAMIESSQDSPQAMKAQHRRLIALWEHYGILVDSGRGHNSLYETLDNDVLRPVRALWQEAWKATVRCRRTKPTNPSGIEWAAIDQPIDLAAYENDIELALVETTRGVAYLGIPEDDDVYGVFCGEVEAGFFRYPEQSNSFARIVQLSRELIIAAGLHVNEIWKQWFQRVASKCTEIVLMDRYSFTRQNFEGLCRILYLLGGDGSKSQVTIFASDPSTLGGATVTDPHIAAKLQRQLSDPHNSLQGISIVFVPDNHSCQTIR